MGQETSISWCDHTFNPWWGCVKVSPACTHCYAETMSKRVGLKVWGTENGRRFFGDKHWREPLAWNEAAFQAGVRRRVFCASMADVFEDRADLVDERARLFVLIEQTPYLDWLLLTKRPENIARLMPAYYGGKPWPNVWLGTTVENQQYADVRIPALLELPAVVRFVSAEPLLGPIRFADVPGFNKCGSAGQDAIRNFWVITGGESGAQHRPSDPDWFRSLRDQCRVAGVPFHFKQWGGARPKANGRELDGREWLEFPSVASVA